MGHESESDIRKLNKLKTKIDINSSPIEELLQLAEMYIEPFHEEGKAISILRTALNRQPDNCEAAILLSYCYIHYSMDKESLTNVVKLLESIDEVKCKYKGAALMLLAEALDDLEISDINEQIKLYEMSIQYEPDWVLNYYNLAWAYKVAGRLTDAILVLNRAKMNIKDEKDKEDFIEENIGGIYYTRQFIDEEIRALKNINFSN